MYKTDITEEIVLKGFREGIDCSQAVFGEFAPQLGVDRDTAMKIAACFGGGMWEGETCGAVTGALMAIGLRYGQGNGTDPDKKNDMIKKLHQFQDEFSKEYGSCICREILGYKIPEDMEQIMEENKFEDLCGKLVIDACEICAELLNED